jgi:hypothetical protein
LASRLRSAQPPAAHCTQTERRSGTRAGSRPIRTSRESGPIRDLVLARSRHAFAASVTPDCSSCRGGLVVAPPACLFRHCASRETSSKSTRDDDFHEKRTGGVLTSISTHDIVISIAAALSLAAFRTRFRSRNQCSQQFSQALFTWQRASLPPHFASFPRPPSRLVRDAPMGSVRGDTSMSLCARCRCEFAPYAPARARRRCRCRSFLRLAAHRQALRRSAG